MWMAVVGCLWTAVWLCGGVVRAWVAVDMEEETWRRVMLEESWFKVEVVQVPLQLSSVTLCGAACMRHDWCNLWCRPSSTECLLTSLIVSGSYRPSQPHDALICYTSREPEMAFGANITSSPPSDAERGKENLVDGVFIGTLQGCAAVEPVNSTKAWLLVDFGVVRRVSKVFLKAQPTDLAAKRFSGFEVKVGNVEEAGDFTSYTPLGTFRDSVVAGQEVTLRPPVPLFGRFVSIQKSKLGILQIAHLEIF